MKYEEEALLEWY